MAKLTKTETDYRYYEFELTDAQAELYRDDPSSFMDSVEVEWQFVGDGQGRDEIDIE